MENYPCFYRNRENKKDEFQIINDGKNAIVFSGFETDKCFQDEKEFVYQWTRNSQKKVKGVQKTYYNCQSQRCFSKAYLVGDELIINEQGDHSKSCLKLLSIVRRTLTEEHKGVVGKLMHKLSVDGIISHFEQKHRYLITKKH